MSVIEDLFADLLSGKDWTLVVEIQFKETVGEKRKGLFS